MWKGTLQEKKLSVDYFDAALIISHVLLLCRRIEECIRKSKHKDCKENNSNIKLQGSKPIKEQPVSKIVTLELRTNGSDD